MAEPEALYPDLRPPRAPRAARLEVQRPDAADTPDPEVLRVVNAASRKGVALEIQLIPGMMHTAEEAAAAVDAELGRIVNAIVLVAPRADGRLIPIVFLGSGHNQADLGLVAAVTGEVAVRLATARETIELTGYAVGGIPPLGYGRDVRVVMDQDLCQYQSVWAAAGTTDAIFQIAPGTLRMLSNAVVAPPAETSWVRRAGLQFEPRSNFEAGAGA